MNPLELRGQWGHSETNKGSSIRLYASVPEDTKTMHEISSKYSLQNLHCTKKWSFPSWISSVNVTKSTVSCGFGHIYWRNP